MIRVFEDLGLLTRAAADYVSDLAEQSIQESGRFTWLLCGGATPRPTFQLLGTKPYKGRTFWAKTHFYWGDERCVPPDSEQSNYRMARHNLLDGVATPDSQVHRMPGERRDYDAAADEYASILPDRPDLVLLGMGDDGHTASIFPGSLAIDEQDRRVMHVVAPEGVTPRDRLTITPSVIRSARRVLVLVSGQPKAHAMGKVFRPEGDEHRAPARLVREALWFADKMAAQEVLKMKLGYIELS